MYTLFGVVEFKMTLNSKLYNIVYSFILGKLKDSKSILILSQTDLERVTQLSKNDITVLQQAVAHSVSRIPMVTGKFV